jgi:ribosomal-protein-serine acetyltransferase
VRTELSDGTITIRAYTPSIESAVLEAAQESLCEIQSIMRTSRDGATYQKAAFHVDESIDAWRTGAWYDFAINPVGLDQIRARRSANVGYWIRTSRTRQSIATAAVRLIARFAFEDLALQQLELDIAADNRASQRVAEKVGARMLPSSRTSSRTYVLALSG